MSRIMEHFAAKIIIKGGSKCIDLLKSHRHFNLCKRIVEENPDYEGIPDYRFFWAVVLHICLLSSDTWDVYNLIKMIESSELISSSVSLMLWFSLNLYLIFKIFLIYFQEMIDYLYCICCFLLHFVNKFQLPSK